MKRLIFILVFVLATLTSMAQINVSGVVIEDVATKGTVWDGYQPL